MESIFLVTCSARRFQKVPELVNLGKQKLQERLGRLIEACSKEASTGRLIFSQGTKEHNRVRFDHTFGWARPEESRAKHGCFGHCSIMCTCPQKERERTMSNSVKWIASQELLLCGLCHGGARNESNAYLCISNKIGMVRIDHTPKP